LTLLHGLLTVQEVAQEFESSSLQQAVDDVRDSLGESAKSPYLAEIFAFGSTGEVLSAALRMDLPGFLSGRESGGGLSGFRPTRTVDLDLAQNNATTTDSSVTWKLPRGSVEKPSPPHIPAPA